MILTFVIFSTVTFTFDLILGQQLGQQRAVYFSKDDKIKTHETKNYFLDGYGRIRMFHGVNAVIKTFPWYPAFLLEEEILDDLEIWGINVVRLGTMWAGVEPTEGQYNQTYIDQLHQIVKKLSERGIYVIMDMHQDAFSAYYEGFPPWLEERYPPKNHSYPYPLPSVDVWEQTYLTEEVSANFQHFYDNYAESTDRWGDFWEELASQFGSYPSVLGYELMNEPWVGNYLQQSDLLLPAVAGQRHLVPLYDKANDRIREVDQSTIIFYEPVLFGQAASDDVYGSGFETVPGGPKNRNVSAYSFHLYCWTLEMSSDTLNDTAKDSLVNYCNNYLFPEVLEAAVETIKTTGGAAMLTQFGQCNTWEKTINVECESILDLCDDHLMSWIEWGYPWDWYEADGKPIWPKIDVYLRPYAQAVAGTPTFQKYSDDVKVYHLHYIANITISEATEIYIPSRKYDGGYAIAVSPLYVQYSFSEFILYVFNKGLKQHQEVKIKILPKPE